jgi:hypothetical protein
MCDSWGKTDGNGEFLRMVYGGVLWNAVHHLSNFQKQMFEIHGPGELLSVCPISAIS